MSKRSLALGAAAVVVAIAAVAVWWWWQVRQAAKRWEGPVKEIAYEKLEKEGSTWHVEFRSQFEAPRDRVYEAFTHPEQSAQHSDQITVSRLIRQSGNVKVVEIHARALGQLQVLTIEFTFHPDEYRITTRTLQAKLADIQSEYTFSQSPDGRRTELRYVSTVREKMVLPFPDSVQKGAIKETFVNQVRAAKRYMGLEVPRTGG